MLTLFTLPNSVESGTQEMVLDMGTGASTNGLFAQISTGPFIFDSKRFIESDDFTEPEYQQFYQYGLGPPDNFGKTSPKGENPVSHQKLDGTIIFDYREQNLNLPYIVKEKAAAPISYWDIGGEPVYRYAWKWQQDDKTYLASPRPRYNLNADTNSKVATVNRYDMTQHISVLKSNVPIPVEDYSEKMLTKDICLRDSTRTNTTARNKIRYGYSITPWGLYEFHMVTVESTAGGGGFHDVRTTLSVWEAGVDGKVVGTNQIRFNYKGEKNTYVLNHELRSVESITTTPFTAYAIGYPTSPRLSCDIEHAKGIHLNYLHQNKINRLVARAMLATDKVDIDHYECAHEALDQMEILDMNNLENLTGFKDGVRGILPPYREFITALKDPENPFKWLKFAANSHLWYSYVAAPTAGDLTVLLKSYESIVRDLKKRDYHKFRTYRAKRTEEVLVDDFIITKILTSKIKVRSRLGGTLSNVYFKSKSLGLNPSLKNLWDLVPYSFVADWFVSIGDLADAIDYEAEMPTYDIAYNLQGSKLVVKIPLEQFNLSRVIRGTDVIYSDYQRARFTTLPHSRLGVEYSLPTLDKVFLGTSLVITSKK